MSDNLVIKTQPGPQSELLACPANEIFYGGARGGGKSFGILLDFASHAFAHPRAKGILFRRTYPELEDLQDKSKTMYPMLGAVWKANNRVWQFENGSNLKMRYLDRDDTVNRYLGHEYSWIGLDQLESWPLQTTYDKLKGNLRSAEGIPTRMVSTGNPGGVGHNWVKARFVDPAPPRTLIQDAQGSTRCFIPARLQDNKILTDADPTYIDRLKNSGPDWLIKAWLDGDWNIVAGGMFDDLWHTKEHVIEPFQIPETWRVDRSFDWGSTRPFAVQWWAESDGETMPNGNFYPKGTLFHIAEWYGCNGKPNEGLRMLASEVGRGIREKEQRMDVHAYPGPADPSIFASENGTSIADEMGRVGCRWEKANNTRKSGWERMRRLMKASLDQNMEEQGLFIFNTCRHFIRTVPSLPRDQRDLDDADTNAEDHAADACRYRIMKTSSTISHTRLKGL